MFYSPVYYLRVHVPATHVLVLCCTACLILTFWNFSARYDDVAVRPDSVIHLKCEYISISAFHHVDVKIKGYYASECSACIRGCHSPTLIGCGSSAEFSDLNFGEADLVSRVWFGGAKGSAVYRS